MKIGLITTSKHATPAEMGAMAGAGDIQLQRDFCPLWNIAAPDLRVFADVKSCVAAGFWPITLFDHPDVANALGYHDEVGDQPYGKVFLDPILENGGTILGDAKNPTDPSVSATLAHELMELVADPWATFWADGKPLPQGSNYALESADPVENDGYVVSVGAHQVVMSNFVTQRWFNRQGKAGDKFDFLGKLKAPFTMDDGGYLIIRKAPGSETQVFAESYPEWKLEQKKSEFARTYRRMAVEAA